jgi:KUP system potassium uptake protein
MRQATGTVFGDIGTSVLYTLIEIVREVGRLDHTCGPRELLGGVSLIFWALIFLTIKYDLLITRADNKGEGGTFALWGLLRGVTGKIIGIGVVGILVVMATGLLAADGLITPVISILGAYEPLGEFAAVIATIVTLVVLFSVQWRGTERVGGFFGYFMMFVWFPWIALKGAPWVWHHPEVLAAANPMYAIEFISNHGWIGSLIVLGAVVLCMTGGEAMYADLGHFGRKPIVLSWRTFVLPCLLINYFGQAALAIHLGPEGLFLQKDGAPVLDDKGHLQPINTFYDLIPPGLGGPVVYLILHSLDIVISTLAAIIASQALISGMFSVVKQAIVLGFSPRFDVKYTSKEVEGQVYIPAVNNAMLVGCIILTLAFRTTSNLAAAYGIAVTGTMAITTFCFAYVAIYVWKFRPWLVWAVCGPLLAIDLMFFLANSLKFGEGGYFPVLVAVVLFTCMLIWEWGRAQMAAAFAHYNGKSIQWLTDLRDMLTECKQAVAEELYMAARLVQGQRELVEINRAIVFLCSRPIRNLTDKVPVVIRVFLKKTGALPRHITLLHIHQIEEAEVHGDRYEVIEMRPGIVSVIVTYGYAEQPDIRKALHELQEQKRIRIPSERWIIESGEEEILLGQGLSFWNRLRLMLFRTILRLSTPAYRYFGLGSDAGVSKSVLPVLFEKDGPRLELPELEASVHEPENAQEKLTG